MRSPLSNALAILSANIGPVSGSGYMARLRATGADWGLDTRIIF